MKSLTQGSKKEWLLLSIIVIIKIATSFIAVNPVFELHRDEFLHLDQGNHLAWGYISVPPFTSWNSLLIKWLGNGSFWVKLFPALWGALTIVSAWLIARTLNAGLYAKILIAVALMCSVMTRLNTLYQPNSFDVLSWTLLYLFLIKYFQSKKSKWLYVAAVFFAIGFLNKYNIVFIAIALIPALLITKQRSIFYDKHLYGAASLALLLISPNLVWQYNNSFPVIHHMKELAETQLVNVSRADFLRTQVLFFFPAIFLLITAFISFINYKPFAGFRFVGWSYVFCIILFLVLKAKDYYAIGLYPVLISFGAVKLEQLFESVRTRKWKLVSFAVIIILFIPMLIVLPAYTPEWMMKQKTLYKKAGLLRWNDGTEHALPQDFADMLGWKELAFKTDSLYKILPAGEGNLILCDNYGLAGGINYYANQQAASFNADYINWFDFSRPIQNLVLVREADHNKQETAQIMKAFKTAYLADSLSNPYCVEKGAKIFVLKRSLIDLNGLLQKKMNEIKTSSK